MVMNGREDEEHRDFACTFGCFWQFIGCHFPKKHFLAGISSGGSEPMLDETQVSPSIHPTTIFWEECISPSRADRH